MSESPFFGELYLRSTRPFLADSVTQAEVEFLKRHLDPHGPKLDLGCGHARHLVAIPQAVGVDSDAVSLEEARKSKAQIVRADFCALPFKTQCFTGGWAWYNTLGTCDDVALEGALREVARCLTPGSTFWIHGSHLSAVAREPHATFEGTLPDGSLLQESATYNELLQLDDIVRRLTFPGGRILEATFFIRYFSMEAWTARFEVVGLDLCGVFGDVWDGPLSASSTELIVGAKKRG